MEKQLDTVALEQEQTKLARRSARYERVQMYLAWLRTLAVVAVAVIVILAVMRLGPQITDTLNQANAAVGSLNAVAAELTELDISGMFGEMEGLMGQAEEAVGAATETMEGSLAVIEGIDLKTLNEAINDFASVVEPLARLFGR